MHNELIKSLTMETTREVTVYCQLIQELQKRNSALIIENTKMLDQYTDLHESNVKIAKQHSELTRNNTDLSLKYSQLNESIGDASQDFNAIINNLTLQNSDLGKKYGDLNQKYSELNLNSVAVSNSVDVLSAEKTRMDLENSELKTVIERYRLSNAEHEQMNTQLVSQNSELTMSTARLTRECFALNSVSAELTQESSALINSNSQFVRECADLREFKTGLEVELGKSKGVNASLVAEKLVLNDTVGRLELEILNSVKTKEENGHFKNVIRDMRVAMEEMMETPAVEDPEMTELRLNLSTQKLEVERLKFEREKLIGMSNMLRAERKTKDDGVQAAADDSNANDGTSLRPKENYRSRVTQSDRATSSQERIKMKLNNSLKNLDMDVKGNAIDGRVRGVRNWNEKGDDS